MLSKVSIRDPTIHHGIFPLTLKVILLKPHFYIHMQIVHDESVIKYCYANYALHIENSNLIISPLAIVDCVHHLCRLISLLVHFKFKRFFQNSSLVYRFRIKQVKASKFCFCFCFCLFVYLLMCFCFCFCFVFCMVLLLVGRGDNLQLFISPLLKYEGCLYNIIDDKNFEINSLEPPCTGGLKIPHTPMGTCRNAKN